ncbi:MAG: hypothetical protein KJZ64_01650 [Sphingomonadaceae bacterium]|nr:hypothetical protein [Sphingomonadaceae bacterium]
MALSILAGLVLAQAPAATVDVAFTELAAGRNEAAIVRIEGNPDLAENDHARLINLGVAHAREGRTEEARAMFRMAVRARDSVQLETATGAWVDSRDLARTALAMLDRGAFQPGPVFAAR